MKIGIDLRPLQNGHKYRGIGEVAKQVTNRVLAHGSRDNVEFIFYENDEDDPTLLLNLPEGLKYSTVKLGPNPENTGSSQTKYQKLRRAYADLYGSPIKDASKSDAFLQYDFAAGIPKGTKTLLVKHDLIPYIFWDKYFESAWVPFKNKAARTTFRTLFANYKFMRLLRRSLKSAYVIATVSESTKNDIEKYFKVKPSKIKVAKLGVAVEPAKTNDIDRRDEMPTKPYLLFVGAGDARRRVDDLVAAFNNLRAAGSDIQLVLVGENFKSPHQIPNQLVRSEVLKSSYKRDILTLGYVDDETKQQLFKNALAYVYPTKYEGFGIPILESMLMECPVIVYKNSSTYEVGGDHATYAKDWQSIVEEVKKLIDEPFESRRTRVVEAKKYAEQFTWDKTANVIYNELITIANSGR